MFTLTISICCFWNNQLQGPGGAAPVNRAQLGFHDFGGVGWDGGWGGGRGAGSDYAELGTAVGGELSRFLEENRGSRDK